MQTACLNFREEFRLLIIVQEQMLHAHLYKKKKTLQLLIYTLNKIYKILLDTNKKIGTELPICNHQIPK